MVDDSDFNKNFQIHSGESSLYKTANNFKKCSLVLPEKILYTNNNPINMIGNILFQINGKFNYLFKGLARENTIK